MGLISIYYGLEARDSEDLKVLGYEDEVSLCLVWGGAALIFTSGIGWTAAFSKSHCLAFCFGYLCMCIMLIYASLGTTVLVLNNNMYDYIDDSCTNEAGTFYEID